MPPRILLTRRWPDPVEAYLRQHYEVTVDPSDRPLSAAELTEAMWEFDAICPTVTDRIGATILAVPHPRVRILGNYGAGIDHIDLTAATAAGIIVTNTPDVLTDAMADLAILLMLMASRRAGEGERELRAGLWTGWRPTHLQGQGLSGKRLGLVGFGRIAQATAARARAFGLSIAYYSRHGADAAIEQALGAMHVESLEELAATSDILSLHCPGGPATRHLVNASLLSRMKPTAILVNTARGSVVNEADLAVALANGTIAAAGLDVFELEPAVNPALIALPNAVLLPHLGSATLETRTAMGMRVAANLDRFFAGEAPHDRVA
jgi:lactate dehydrogenase-like 2-hydroxyacid dehydrogenase